MKRFSIQPACCGLLMVLTYLLAACGTGATSTPPTASPAAASPTAIAAPTQAAPPTAIAAPTATLPAVPTQPALPTAIAAPTATPPAAATQAASPTAVAAPTATLPAATTQAGTANVLIVYHKSGGFVGIDETLTVYADGTTELRNRRDTVTAQADPATLQALQTLLASPEFAALQIPAQPPAADAFVYELTQPGRAQPIIATDSANIPPLLRQVIDLLEKMKKT